MAENDAVVLALAEGEKVAAGEFVAWPLADAEAVAEADGAIGRESMRIL